MVPVTSNNGFCLPYRGTSTVENKGFRVVPLLSSYHIGSIYTICFKIGLFRQLYTILRWIGRTGPCSTKEKCGSKTILLFKIAKTCWNITVKNQFIVCVYIYLQYVPTTGEKHCWKFFCIWRFTLTLTLTLTVYRTAIGKRNNWVCFSVQVFTVNCGNSIMGCGI